MVALEKFGFKTSGNMSQAQRTESIIVSLPVTGYPKRLPTSLAWKDITEGLKSWRIWSLLASQEIKQRYRRSTLGPFWITLSMAITVYSMGFLYSRLFHLDLESYYPFLTGGMLAWTLISTLISELTEAFINAEGYIRQIKLPYSLHIHKVIWRNFLIFFHNVIVIVPVLLIFHQVAKVNFNLLWIFPGLLLVYLNGLTYGSMLAMVSARFRDIPQIVRSLMQVIFFMTPVMWNPATLSSKYQMIARINPFYAFIELIRCPLMGMHPSKNTCVMVGVITLAGLLLSWQIWVRYRARIVYWV